LAANALELPSHLLDAVFEHVEGNVRFFLRDHERRARGGSCSARSLEQHAMLEPFSTSGHARARHTLSSFIFTMFDADHQARATGRATSPTNF